MGLYDAGTLEFEHLMHWLTSKASIEYDFL